MPRRGAHAGPIHFRSGRCPRLSRHALVISACAARSIPVLLVVGVGALQSVGARMTRGVAAGDVHASQLLAAAALAVVHGAGAAASVVYATAEGADASVAYTTGPGATKLTPRMMATPLPGLEGSAALGGTAAGSATETVSLKEPPPSWARPLLAGVPAGKRTEADAKAGALGAATRGRGWLARVVTGACATTLPSALVERWRLLSQPSVQREPPAGAAVDA